MVASSFPVQLERGPLAVGTYSVAALIDLNGDGDMAIVLSERYWEGSAI